MNNIELRQHYRSKKEALEIRQGFWLDLLGLIVPLTAPLVPAYLTATAIIEHYPSLLHIGYWWVVAMAVIAGAVIEVLGILSVETMFDMRTYNATVQDDEEKAPFEWAATAVAFYLLLVITLVLLLKIWSDLALWSLAPLTILGFITSWVMVLRNQHSERIWRRESQVNEQTEIERLNTAIEQMIKDGELKINNLREQNRLSIEQIEREHAAALANEQAERERLSGRLIDLDERNKSLLEQMRTDFQAVLTSKEAEREHLKNELFALCERYHALAEKMNEQKSPGPKEELSKRSSGKVDPERVHRYFEMNKDATVRQAAEELGYSVGSINKYKPEPVHLNGRSKVAN